MVVGGPGILQLFLQQILHVGEWLAPSSQNLRPHQLLAHHLDCHFPLDGWRILSSGMMAKV